MIMPKLRSGPATPMTKKLGDKEGYFDAGANAQMHRDFGFTGSLETPNKPAPYARGGDVMPKSGIPEHPMGGSIVDSQKHPNGGAMLIHDHGGFSHVRPDGQVTHHTMDGGMCKGGGVKMAEGGSVDEARGGKIRLPGSIRTAISKRHSPIETPPRNPNQTTTPRNRMSGGVMPYGVEPSAEPMVAGSEQDIPTLRRGGRVR